MFRIEISNENDDDEQDTDDQDDDEGILLDNELWNSLSTGLGQANFNFSLSIDDKSPTHLSEVGLPVVDFNDEQPDPSLEEINETWDKAYPEALTKRDAISERVLETGDKRVN